MKRNGKHGVHQWAFDCVSKICYVQDFTFDTLDVTFINPNLWVIPQMSWYAGLRYSLGSVVINISMLLIVMGHFIVSHHLTIQLIQITGQVTIFLSFNLGSVMWCASCVRAYVNFIDVISEFYIFISLLFIRFLVFDILCLASFSRNSADNSNSHREVWRGKECAKHTWLLCFWM